MIQIAERFETWQLIAYNPTKYANFKAEKYEMSSWWCHDCFFQSLCKTWSRQAIALKLCNLLTFRKFLKICRFKNMWHEWCHNYVITKDNGKIRTSDKPVNLCIIRKVLMRAFQKFKFYQTWAILSKVMSTEVKFWPFYHKH